MPLQALPRALAGATPSRQLRVRTPRPRQILSPFSAYASWAYSSSGSISSIARCLPGGSSGNLSGLQGSPSYSNLSSLDLPAELVVPQIASSKLPTATSHASSLDGVLAQQSSRVDEMERPLADQSVRPTLHKSSFARVTIA